MSSSEGEKPPLDETQVLRAEGSNMGHLRMVPNNLADKSAATFLVVHPESDAADRIVAALRQAGTGIRVWGIDPETRNRGAIKNELRALAAEARVSKGAPLLFVLPFNAALLRKVKRAFENSRWILLADDPAALLIGGENAAPNSRKALLKVGKELLHWIEFVGRSQDEMLVLSARKTREFSSEALAGIFAMLRMEVDTPTFDESVKILSRVELAAPRFMIDNQTQTQLFKCGTDSIMKRGILAGWVKRVLDDEPVEVKVIMDGAEVARGLANHFRQSLFELSIGSGNHGYSIDLSAHLGSAVRRVEVWTVETPTLVGVALMNAVSGRRSDEVDQLQVAGEPPAAAANSLG
jgi:hypothetical protein